MRVTRTAGGLQSLQFVDEAGNRCIAEQSPEVDPNNPCADQVGSSYLLLGRHDAPVQLNLDQVGELVEWLQKWLEHGEFMTSLSHAGLQGSAPDRRLPAPHLQILQGKRRPSLPK